MQAAKEMKDLKNILERKYHVIAGRPAAYSQTDEPYAVIYAVKEIQFADATAADLAELIVGIKELFNAHQLRRRSELGLSPEYIGPFYLYWRREPWFAVEKITNETEDADGNITEEITGYRAKIGMRVLITDKKADPYVDTGEFTEAKIEGAIDEIKNAPAEIAAGNIGPIQKFSPQFEDYIRQGMSHLHGPADRAELRRERIEYHPSGRLKVTYIWKSGHEDFVWVQPPAWEMRKFTPEYEEYIREITNPDGRGNSALDPVKFAQMPPQDRLTRETVDDAPGGGLSCEFHWEAGRQDVWCKLGDPVKIQAS